MSTSAWKSLQKFPVQGWVSIGFASPLILNDNELLVVPWTDKSKYLLKYIISENKCLKWIKYPTDLKSNYHTASLNESKTILYIYGNSCRVIEVDLITQTFKESPRKYHDGSYCRSLIINDKFHIFGGWMPEDNEHYIWDKNKQILESIYKFDEIELIRHGGSDDGTPESMRDVYVQYLPSKNAILIIPGYTTTYVYMYYPDKWDCRHKWDLTLDNEKRDADCVITADERFVIIFTRRIQIIDLYKMCLRKTDIRPPNNKSTNKAVIRNDKYLQNIITFGFVRNCWKYPAFKGIDLLPVYLTKIIEKYYHYEVVHVLIEGGSHWTISVDRIIWGLDIKMKNKHLNKWNSQDLAHWIKTVDDGKLRKCLGTGINTVIEHIETGHVKGNEISLINDFTLRIMGVDRKYDRDVWLKYFQRLLAEYD